MRQAVAIMDYGTMVEFVSKFSELEAARHTKLEVDPRIRKGDFEFRVTLTPKRVFRELLATSLHDGMLQRFGVKFKFT